MANLRQQMDAQYEYVNNQLSVKGFEDNISWFLKGERSPLKHLFTNKKGKRTCPMGMELDQWERLVK
jgi:hypothetical protein